MFSLSLSLSLSLVRRVVRRVDVRSFRMKSLVRQCTLPLNVITFATPGELGSPCVPPWMLAWVLGLLSSCRLLPPSLRLPSLSLVLSVPGLGCFVVFLGARSLRGSLSLLASRAGCLSVRVVVVVLLC